MKPSQTTAKVLAHSTYFDDNPTELFTVEATFARSALAELNTHRKFSRNSASSRAIPVNKMLDQVINNPFIPRRFSLAQKGMHTDSFVDYGDDRWFELASKWLDARDSAYWSATHLLNAGLHKQDVNRILEPFLMHTAIISSTEWYNFFKLRLALNENGNPLAYPPIYDLAKAIYDAQIVSEPQLILGGGWHLPLIGFEGDEDLCTDELIRVSAARCARVSYLTHDGQRDVDADLELFERLLKNGHWSPLEHVAFPDSSGGSGNFDNWVQLRAYAENGSL